MMTTKEFSRKSSAFHPVIGPEYLDAPMPKFNPAKINISKMEYECRDKWYKIYFNEEKQEVNIYWETQEECDEHDLLKAEIIRWLRHIGFAGTLHLELTNRDSDRKYKITRKIAK